MLAEGALESPSVLVLAFHSSLFLVRGSSDGSATGDSFLSHGRMWLNHSVSVWELAFLTRLDLLVYYCRCSGAVPRGNFWGSHEGWVFQFSPWIEFWLTSSLSFLGFVVAPSHGFRLRRSGCFWLLGAGSRPVSPLRSLAPSHSGVCAVRVGVPPPPCSLAHCGAPWLMALRSGHCRWSRIHGQASAGLSSVSVRSWCYRASWLAQGYAPLLRPFAFLLALWSRVPSGSLLRFRVKSSRWGHPVGSSLSQSSIGMKTLPPPSWCLVGVFVMRSPYRVEFVSDLDRNEVSSLLP